MVERCFIQRNRQAGGKADGADSFGAHPVAHRQIPVLQDHPVAGWYAIRCDINQQVFAVQAEAQIGGHDAAAKDQGVLPLLVEDGVDAVTDAEAVAIVATTTLEQVVSSAAVQHINTGIAGQSVSQTVTRAVNGVDADQREVFDVAGQAVADAAANCIGAFVGLLDDQIAGVIDDIGVVAGAADQGIGTLSAVQRVVATQAVQRVARFVANQHVASRVARTGQVVRASQGQVLD